MKQITVSDDTGTRINLDATRTLVLNVRGESGVVVGPTTFLEEGEPLPETGWSIVLESSADNCPLEYVMDNGGVEDATELWYETVRTLDAGTIMLNRGAAIDTCRALRDAAKKLTSKLEGATG